MKAWRDGRLVACEALPHGAVVPFETMGIVQGALPLWDRHIARLGAAAMDLGIVGMALDVPTGLREAAIAEASPHGHDVVRIELGHAGDVITWRVHTRVRHVLEGPVVLVPAVARRAPGLPPAHLKALPRSAYDAVLVEARAAGADDGIVVGDDGAVLETALGNLLLWIDAQWVTPSLDGRVLPGIARAVLLGQLAAGGERVVERRCDLADLHRATTIVVCNAVHGPRGAVLMRVPAKGEAAAVAAGPGVDGLRALWDRALAS